MLNKYKVISKAYTNAEADYKWADLIDVEFVVEASDVKQAEAEANDYMLYNYGHEAYNIDTDITEVK